MTNIKYPFSQNVFLFACAETLIPNESMSSKIKTHLSVKVHSPVFKGIQVARWRREGGEHSMRHAKMK